MLRIKIDYNIDFRENSNFFSFFKLKQCYVLKIDNIGFRENSKNIAEN
jgi:hypothetical protein